ncbi:Amphiregulin [Dissostichus eleginoides]|uniref:Amphiregulin n=1 Tax=Dissostichus eleginoides TaxID=100907 RepID=A0AAD9C0V0_DISEL|nr:Amphiregulin [Dissostichus eleginoides]
MNPLIVTCLFCFVSGALGAQGSEATFSGELSGVTAGPASGEGLQTFLSYTPPRFSTNGYTSTHTTTEDPCTSSHLHYCIYGDCKYIEGLQEPVCICMKGYDGGRCEIQSLEVIKTQTDQINNTELVQTVLVIIAVVLSVISCTAILLMTCAHYRSHKNFLASYLGTGTEQEKLQKPIGDVVV